MRASAQQVTELAQRLTIRAGGDARVRNRREAEFTREPEYIPRCEDRAWFGSFVRELPGRLAENSIPGKCRNLRILEREGQRAALKIEGREILCPPA